MFIIEQFKWSLQSSDKIELKHVIKERHLNKNCLVMWQIEAKVVPMTLLPGVLTFVSSPHSECGGTLGVTFHQENMAERIRCIYLC